MKFRLLTAVAVSAVAIWLTAQPASKPLAALTPPGALLYLEAKNLQALLTEWNSSPEKRAWLQSANYQVFTRSRLFLRLKEVYEDYTRALGVAPDMELLASVAGAESAIALYDIQNLEFLYLTRLSSARAIQSMLWKLRGNFSERLASGLSYYVKTQGASQRTAAFALHGDLFFAATREQALTAALALYSGAPVPALASEPWFREALQQSGAAGDLRLVARMERLVRTPAFRSYWIQRNVQALREFHTTVSDLRRQGGEFREERLLLRSEAKKPVESAVLDELASLISPRATVYRAWAGPDPEEAARWIGARLLSVRGEPSAPPGLAPEFVSPSTVAGDESDLETWLDTAAAEDLPASRENGLRNLLVKNPPLALLTLYFEGPSGGGVFLGHDAAVVLRAASPWDGESVRRTLAENLAPRLTTSGFGLNWQEQQGVWKLDALYPLAMQTRGPLLLIASRAEVLGNLASASRTTPLPPHTTYLAGFRLASQVDRFERMMRFIEFPGWDATSSEPPFFSANLASLARSLQRLDTVSIQHQDHGVSLRELVYYRLSP
ncbi:MAG: hypothetical protein NZV14_07910 [Bryobacteraceae bacterium]|nr:hypothetical protein [Bryobacteraceae bacterium]MDW8378071.1 hypothetical protein [Bryobacterales bacterium]